jgi:fatty acid desaturase
MAIDTDIKANGPRKGAGTTRAAAAAREDIADLRSDLAYLRQQVHGLRSKLHGELGVLALRIEDNERRTMKRRKAARRWVMAAVVVVWAWLGSGAVRSMLNGPFLLPGLLLVGMTLLAGITLVLLNLHNDADEQEHSDRHHNWFRLTARE